MRMSKNEADELVNAFGALDSAPDFTGNVHDVLGIVVDAINSTIGGLIITDLAGSICFANRSFYRMFGYSRHEIIGRDAASLFAAKEVRNFSDVIAIIDISKDESEEFTVTVSSGKSIIVEVVASNVTSDSGAVVGRMASFVDISSRKKTEAERDQLIARLQDALDNIKTLRGIIPICASCKKIRDDQGYWNQIETYIKAHSDAVFTHGLCPQCVQKLYPDLDVGELNK